MKKGVLMCLILFLLAAPSSAKELVLGFLPGLGSVGDNGYNTLAYRGMIEAKRILQAKLLMEECRTLEETCPAAESMLQRGASIMVLNGYEYGELAKELTRKYPEVFFILNEIPWPGTENAVSLFYKGWEGAFLAGALAGWTSKTGKTGVVAALPMPIIENLIQGFREGLHHAAPEAALEILYLSETSEGFNMPDKGFEEATKLYRRGADIIFTLSGISGNGVMEAARKEDAFCIGIDSDQDHLARGHVLTSVMKNVDIAIENLVVEAALGSFEPGTRTMGLKEGVVGLSPMRFTRQIIGEETLEKLEKLKESLLENPLPGPEE